MIAFTNSEATTGITVVIRWRRRDGTTAATVTPRLYGLEQERVLWTDSNGHWNTDSEIARDIDEFKKACRKLKLLPRRRPPKPEEHSRRRRNAQPPLRSPVARRTCSGMARVLVPRGC